MTIFFDVDGVLNCKADWQKPFSVNPSCLKVFAEIIHRLGKKENVDLVIVSTWRVGISSTGSDSPQIQNLTGKLSQYGLFISGATPNTLTKSREEEISYYARRHGISHYLILDDDESLYLHPKDIPLYVTDYHTGLTEKDIRPIMQLLSGILKH